MEESIREVLDKLIPNVEPSTRASLSEMMLQRERLNSTMLPNGVAFPRAEAKCARKILCAVGISRNGINCEISADVPVRALFVSLYPEGHFRKFVPVLENLVRFSQDPEKMESLYTLPHGQEAFQVIRNEVFPWGARDWVHSHLLLPINNVRNQMEALVRVRHD